MESSIQRGTWVPSVVVHLIKQNEHFNIARFETVPSEILLDGDPVCSFRGFSLVCTELLPSLTEPVVVPTDKDELPRFEFSWISWVFDEI